MIGLPVRSTSLFHMSTVRTIEKQRDGEGLSRDEIRELVLGYADGSIPDYQMAAFLMAVYFRGLSDDSVVSLTEAMIDSGDTADFSDIGRIALDKHSTGGVGDKTSLVVAPIVAACGFAMLTASRNSR